MSGIDGGDSGTADAIVEIAAGDAAHRSGGGGGIAAVLRALLDVVGTREYHFRAVVCEDRGFRLDVITDFSERDKEGPVAASRCMSCDLGASLRAGLHGDDAADGRREASAGREDGGGGDGGGVASRVELTASDSLMLEGGGVRVWLDAKARNMLIVTPKRHVGSMEDMTDVELRDLWAGCAAAMRREGLGARDVRAMICNSGRAMNHAHVHVKVSEKDGHCRKRHRSSSRRKGSSSLTGFILHVDDFMRVLFPS